jgi:Antirestriction protein
MLEVAINVDRPITATEVPAGERFSFLIRRFDKYHETVDLFLRSFAVELCPDFKGAQWRFFEASTGTVFMVPSGYESLHVRIESNGFDARVSAEVAGLIVSLFVLTRLCAVSRSQEHMRMLVLLRNYALTHAQATTVFRAID